MNSISGGKLCRLCKQEKSLDSFPKNKSQKDGLHYYCKSCTKNIREANKEDNPDYYNNYREKNREKLRKYHKDYRMKNAVIDDSKQLSNIEDKKAKKRAKQRERAKNQDYVQSRKYYFKKKYLADRQWNLKKKYQSKLNKLFHDNDESEKSKALIGCTIPELKELLQTKLLSGMSLENYGTVWFFRIPFSDYDLTIEEEVKRCLHYSRIEPMYNDTKEVVTCSSNDKTDLSD